MTGQLHFLKSVVDQSTTLSKGAPLSRVSRESVIDRSTTLLKFVVDQSTTLCKGAPLSRVSRKSVVDRSTTLFEKCS